MKQIGNKDIETNFINLSNKIDDLNQIETMFLRNQLNDLIIDKLSILSIKFQYCLKKVFLKKCRILYKCRRKKKNLNDVKSKIFPIKNLDQIPTFKPAPEPLSKLEQRNRNKFFKPS